MNRKRDQPFRQIKGEGLDALLGSVPTSEGGVPLEAIHLVTQQPRRYFDPKKMEQLVHSVKEHGILEPLLVRPLNNEEYELVAGERRYRAASEAGLTEVPVVVRQLSDEEALQLALVENLQREDLNPVEETEGILQLLAFKLRISVIEVASLLYRMNNAAAGNINHNVMLNPESDLVQEVFQGLGLMSWESFTRNRLPLLNLPKDILEALRQGQIEYTKAQTIARIKDESKRTALLEQAIAQRLSLNDIRKQITTLHAAGDEAPSLKSRMTQTYHRAQKSKIWNDPKKCQKIEKLLTQIDALLVEEVP